MSDNCRTLATQRVAGGSGALGLTSREVEGGGKDRGTVEQTKQENQLDPQVISRERGQRRKSVYSFEYSILGLYGGRLVGTRHGVIFPFAGCLGKSKKRKRRERKEKKKRKVHHKRHHSTYFGIEILRSPS